jgi:hypothetical protein
MTQDRRSGSVTAKLPPDRGGDAYAVLATDVAERRPSSLIPVVAIARRLVWVRRCTPAASKLPPGRIGKGRRGIQYP